MVVRKFRLRTPESPFRGPFKWNLLNSRVCRWEGAHCLVGGVGGRVGMGGGGGMQDNSGFLTVGGGEEGKG